MLNKRRMEFTAKVKEVIAQRAGYRCCFPGCGRLLVGPDSDPHKSVNIGECAHIYAAAEDGPPGQRLSDGCRVDIIRKWLVPLSRSS